ncbi:hypothetical protein BZB76_0265 [Actinomadura pelletieri DSM 43383]|uniref:AAA domain-containing protein n=1 Tax=Actinomadura pelletieri DSM 43383 TaxID=1120940 RepID=A0A495QXB0_9ACTN|nr:hypothetical protein [Actinomadura pelletieri]RKS78831.1 hypothetical protein BZB76_0265 [Actinomadura pelletieri DSM 43383]
MTTRIEAYGHRCFSRLSVDLNRHHVIVGTTGSGTTTLLDVSVLFGDRVREQRVTGASLQARSGRTPQAGTPLELLHRQEDDTISFAAEARLPADTPKRLACTSMARLGKREPGKHPRAQRTIRSCHTTMGKR